MDNVHCYGTEPTLIDCGASSVGIHNCTASQDVGVRCFGSASTCNDGDIRLRGGNATRGRVEICYNNVWGTVCNNRGWSTANAVVTCRQLGFPAAGMILYVLADNYNEFYSVIDRFCYYHIWFPNWKW